MHNQFFVERDPELKLFGLLSIVIAIVFGISMIFSLRARDVSVPTQVVNTFPQVTIEAKAAYVYDLITGEVIFAQNEDKRLPLASLTKVMSALVANELAPLNSTISVSEEALKTEGDSGLLKDEKWSLDDLLSFSLISSSNDGMRAIALTLGALSRAGASSDEIINDFVGKMNEKASELGLKNTYFWNETGLDESEVKGGAYGTARDVTALLAHVFYTTPELLSDTKEVSATFASLDNKIHTAKNTNSIISDIPKLLASKTGLTDTAGGNLSIIFDPELGHPIVITVMGSSEQGRFQDVRTLVNATLSYLSEK